MAAKPDASALVVPVPQADPVVGPWRTRFDPSAPQGVPAHITLLYPFEPPDHLDQAVLDELRALCATTPAWRFTLAELVDDGGLVHLAPSPAAPFVALTRSFVARWPERLPYRGKYGLDPMPHLSIAYGDTAPSTDQRAALRAAIAPQLPLACRAHQVALWVRREDRWSSHTTFPLG